MKVFLCRYKRGSYLPARSNLEFLSYYDDCRTSLHSASIFSFYAHQFSLYARTNNKHFLYINIPGLKRMGSNEFLPRLDLFPH